MGDDTTQQIIGEKMAQRQMEMNRVKLESESEDGSARRRDMDALLDLFLDSFGSLHRDHGDLISTMVCIMEGVKTEEGGEWRDPSENASEGLDI